MEVDCCLQKCNCVTTHHWFRVMHSAGVLQGSKILLTGHEEISPPGQQFQNDSWMKWPTNGVKWPHKWTGDPSNVCTDPGWHRLCPGASSSDLWPKQLDFFFMLPFKRVGRKVPTVFIGSLVICLHGDGWSHKKHIFGNQKTTTDWKGVRLVSSLGNASTASHWILS